MIISIKNIAKTHNTPFNSLYGKKQSQNTTTTYPYIPKNVYLNGQVSFKGQMEDDYFRSARVGDVSGQLQKLGNIQFDITEVEPDTGNNFLHTALKSQHKQIINRAIILLKQKTGNDKELAKSIINKENNENKKPYDYTTDAAVINILKKLTGEELSTNSEDSLNKLPEGTTINIPSFDDDEEGDFETASSKTEVEQLQKSQPSLLEVTGLGKIKETLLNRIVKPLKDGKKVTDSGFLIHGTSGNGKSYLLNSLAMSLNKDITTEKTFEKMVVAVIEKSGDDPKKVEEGVAKIFEENIIRIEDVQELEAVTEFAKINFKKTNKQAVIYIDEVKGILPEVAAPQSNSITKAEQIIENSAAQGFIVVATTREEKAISPDSIRKGRFDYHLEVKSPNAEERKDLIEKTLADKSRLPEKELKSLVKLTAGFTYLNLTKFVDGLNEDGSAKIDNIKVELQKYADANNLGKITEIGVTSNYDTKLKRATIVNPANFDVVAGMADVKNEFKSKLIDRLKPEALKRFKDNNRPPIKTGFLLYGPPGTGKTYITEALAGEMKLPLYKLDTASFEDKFVGESEKNLKGIFEQLETKFKETGEYSILFIDEANKILGSRDDKSASGYKSGIVEEFLMHLNNAPERGIIPIIATNFKDKIDKAIVSRLGVPVLIDYPDAEARKAVIKLTFKDVKTTENINEEDIAEISSRLSGFGTREIVQILSNTIDSSLAYGDEKLTVEEFKREIADFALSHDMPEINDRNKTSSYDTYIKRVKIYPDDPQTLDDLGGLKEVKKQLLDATSFETNNPEITERYKKNRIKNEHSVLLYGEPGCGKTFILKALSAHLNLPLYEFKLSDQGSSYVHDTTGNIGKIFNQLKEKYQKTGEKSILMIDEFEDMAGKRELNGNSAHKQEETDALLKEIADAPKNGIIVVAATNFYNKIDDAMKRPGRFVTINVPHPDFDSRVDILKKALKGREIAEKVHANEDSLKTLAEITDGFSIADIVANIDPFIKKSIENHVDKLTVDDFVDLFSNYRLEKEYAIEKGK